MTAALGFPREPPLFCFFTQGAFITVGILFVMSLFRLLTLWFNFGVLGEPRNSSFSFRFQLNRGQVFEAFPYNILNFFGVF